MNFQLKLYQLIKPHLRDQKYEISSWSSLLSFESDGYPGKQSVGRLFPFLQADKPLQCSFYFRTVLGGLINPRYLLEEKEVQGS